MIISRTPYRISFFGGGTDYPSWYLKYGGSVLATSINKYCYLNCRHLPPFFEHRLRVVYSKIESVKTIDEIKHPSAREVLRFLKCDKGLEIHHDGDLPARSGMGSSSAFTVGLLHALYGLEGIMPGKRRLAMEAVHIEQNLIMETVGSQDQVSAAFGGFNHIKFGQDGEIEVHPITISTLRKNELNSHLMLFYTGIMRTASNVAMSYAGNVEINKKRLSAMSEMVEEALNILKGNSCICKFGELMNQGWLAKRGLSSQVSNSVVDELYEKAMQNGALGGKIIGAGGGGFLLFFVPPTRQEHVKRALNNLLHVPFEFETSGSQIVFYEPAKEDFAMIERSQDRSQIAAFREISSLPHQG